MTQQLNEMIAVLHKLGDRRSIAEAVAKMAAPKVEAAIQATARAGESPSGVAWAPRKKDGGQALANVAGKITTVATGRNIKVTLKGPEVYSHLAAGKSRRPVIPGSEGELPDSIYKVCLESSELIFQATLGGD